MRLLRLRRRQLVFGLGWPEVAVVSVVVFALFGAKRIPELARSMGRGLREFREELQASGKSETAEAQPPDPPKPKE